MSRSKEPAQNAALRHQSDRARVQFTNSDRLVFIQLYRCFPSVLKTITIIQPEYAGIGPVAWALIRRMSVDNLIPAHKASRASASAGGAIAISDFAVCAGTAAGQIT